MRQSIRSFAAILLACSLLAGCVSRQLPATPVPSPSVAATTPAGAASPGIISPATASPAQAGVTGAAPAAAPAAVCSAAATGNQYFASLADPDYDAQHYSIALDVNMAAHVITGTTTMQAIARQPLQEFTLDLAGFAITDVTVNGHPARYTRGSVAMTVTVPLAIQAGEAFSSTVSYAGTPVPARDQGIPITTGWIFTNGGSYVASEPAGAHTWYPVNDHPCDKASYTFRISVPRTYVVAANGLLESQTDRGDTSTYVWQETAPMASYLATVNIGAYVTRTATAAGGLPVRSFFPPAQANTLAPSFQRMPEMIDYYSSIFGPYPFEAYGVIVVDSREGYALEDQTLTLFTTAMIDAVRADPEVTVAHELAHQWFGDSVSLTSWQDTWLNEGFATYASELWLEHARGEQKLNSDIQAMYKAMKSQQAPAPGTPSLNQLFGASVYYRGALVLHALRLNVGDATFFKILRTYADRYRYGNATTADFIALAQEVSGRDLGQFFQDWLFGADMPALPQG